MNTGIQIQEYRNRNMDNYIFVRAALTFFRDSHTLPVIPSQFPVMAVALQVAARWVKGHLVLYLVLTSSVVFSPNI